MIETSNKEAMSIAIKFFKGNIALSLTTLTILAILSLLKAIPSIGFISSFAYSILGFSIQIYLMRQVDNINRSEDIEYIANRTSLKELLTTHLDIAIGGFIGIFLTFIILGTLLVAFLSTQMNLQNMANTNINIFIQNFSNLPNSLAISTAILIIMSFLGYVFPAVVGEMMMSNSLKEAFIKSFLIFNPKIWRRTFTKEYFKLIMLWTLVVFVAIILISLISRMVLLLPIVFILIYALLLYNANIYLFAKRVLKD